MTYKEALAEAKEIGMNRCSATAHLATICKAIDLIHPGINPELLFNGAVKKGLDAHQVADLANKDPIGLGDLMFV